MSAAQDNDLTYELYREIAEDLCVPVDEKLSLDVRFELYNSKLVYLRNLHEQAFRSLNQPGEASTFTHEDLVVISKAIASTQTFLRQTVLSTLSQSFARVA